MTDIPGDPFAPDVLAATAPPKRTNGAGLREVTDEEPPPPRLALNKAGNPRVIVANVIDMLAEHDEWKGVLVWDEFAQTVRKTRPPPVRSNDRSSRVTAGEWCDADTTRVQAWLQKQPQIHRLDPPANMIEAAVRAVAERRSIHPVREWLRSLAWDGTQRLPMLFPGYFGAVDTPLIREVGKRWMISAVARVMTPGCQCKYMPVLEAEQDAGKSKGIAALVGSSPSGESWYNETPLRIGDKDSYQCLRAKLVHEWGELAAFKSARDVETLKSFISSRTDTFRESYGRRSQDCPRQCVFIGTTNEKRWLTDPTGGSRFWPVRCRADVPVDVAGIERDREQLWAEAFVRFEAHEIHWLDPQTEPHLLADARLEQKERTEADPWVDLVRAWLEHPTLPDDDAGGRRIPDLAAGLTSTDVLIGACSMRRADLTRAHATRIGYVMAEIGWTHYRTSRDDGSRPRVYLPPGQARPAE